LVDAQGCGEEIEKGLEAIAHLGGELWTMHGVVGGCGVAPILCLRGEVWWWGHYVLL
jgi:hypothetical protein